MRNLRPTLVSVVVAAKNVPLIFVKDEDAGTNFFIIGIWETHQCLVHMLIYSDFTFGFMPLKDNFEGRGAYKLTYYCVLRVGAKAPSRIIDTLFRRKKCVH